MISIDPRNISKVTAAANQISYFVGQKHFQKLFQLHFSSTYWSGYMIGMGSNIVLFFNETEIFRNSSIEIFIDSVWTISSFIQYTAISINNEIWNILIFIEFSLSLLIREILNLLGTSEYIWNFISLGTSYPNGSSYGNIKIEASINFIQSICIL